MSKSPENTLTRQRFNRQRLFGRRIFLGMALGAGAMGAFSYLSTESKAPGAQAQALKDQSAIQVAQAQLNADTAKQKALLGSVSPDCAAIVRQFLGNSDYAESYSTIDAQTLVTETRACPVTDVQLVYNARDNDRSIQGDNQAMESSQSDMALQLSALSDPYSDRRGNTESGILMGVAIGMAAGLASDVSTGRRRAQAPAS